MKKLVSCLLITMLLLTAACAPPQRGSIRPPSAGPGGETPSPSDPPADTLFTRETYPMVDGSTATIPLSVAVLSRTCGIPMEEAELYVSHSKTNEAYMQLILGQADVLLAYEAPESAKLSAEYQHFRWDAQPIGRDALVFLVNENNPVDSLTGQQLLDIYTGKITNWKDVGGEDIEIIPFQRDENSGSQTLMNKLVMKGQPMYNAPAVLDYIPSEMGELIEAIAAYDNSSNAIGYSVYYYVSQMFQMPGIKMIAVDGTAPTNETISSAQYPYLNDFYVVINEEAPQGSPARKLFDFMLSGDGKKLVEESGYVAVK